MKRGGDCRAVVQAYVRSQPQDEDAKYLAKLVWSSQFNERTFA